MYVQFCHHMQSVEYRQNLEQNIAVEMVRIIVSVSCEACVVPHHSLMFNAVYLYLNM